MSRKQVDQNTQDIGVLKDTMTRLENTVDKYITSTTAIETDRQKRLDNRIQLVGAFCAVTAIGISLIPLFHKQPPPQQNINHNLGNIETFHQYLEFQKWQQHRGGVTQ